MRDSVVTDKTLGALYSPKTLGRHSDLDEGYQPHPQCPQCDMFVLQEALNRANLTSMMCWIGTESKIQRLVAEEVT